MKWHPWGLVYPWGVGIPWNSIEFHGVRASPPPPSIYRFRPNPCIATSKPSYFPWKIGRDSRPISFVNC